MEEDLLPYGGKQPRAPGDGARPLAATSAYTQAYSRVRLAVVEDFAGGSITLPHVPAPAQLAFCRLPFEIVSTTNWDTLLERGFDLVEREHYVIVEAEQLPIAVNPRSVTLVKLHGDLDHPHRLVATEADYDRFISSNPLLVTYALTY